jgi:hypothetical protein
MARTYLSTLSPHRRWGIAGAAAGTALVLTAGLGEPWGFSAVSGLPKDSVVNNVPLLAGTLQVFHWTTSSVGLGGSGPWVSAIVLDLVWPLLILIGARALAGGLALRRARLSLCVGVWSMATLTGAFAGLVAGLAEHGDRVGWMRVGFVTVTPQTSTGDLLTLQAATMALVGVLIGWLPGVAAAVAYSVKRPAQPEAASAKAGESSGDEKTLTEESTGTLSLESLEELRRVRNKESGTLPDARTSEFFRV